MTITITGASGFVGQHLSKHLADRGHEIRGLSLRSADWETDLGDGVDVFGDAVVHLAGKAHDTAGTAEPEAYFRVNRDLTQALFQRFLASDARDFIYFSSVKTVADAVDGTLDENHPAMPKTPYGQSKWEAEQYLSAQALPEGKRLFILRPCMIHGPGNKGNLNLLYQIVSKGIPWPLAAFENRRSFLSIDNLCFVVASLLEGQVRGDVDDAAKGVPASGAGLCGGVFNLADDESLSTNELIRLIGEVRGRSVQLWRVPVGLVRFGARVVGVLRLPLNTERLGKLTENYVVSNAKIKTALGVEKLPVSAREGLRKTLKSF